MLFLEELIRNPKSWRQVTNVPGVLLHTAGKALRCLPEIHILTALALARLSEITFILQKIEKHDFSALHADA